MQLHFQKNFSDAKIMQTERNAKEKLEKRTFLFIADVQFILCKREFGIRKRLKKLWE